MQPVNTHLLEEIGFSKGEIKVYFALLEIGESSIGLISKKSQVTAAKVYPILDKLIRKGLASHIIKNNTKYFVAASPERIIDYLDTKNRHIEEEKKEIRKLIPIIELNKKFQKYPQTARVFQTFDGLKTLYNEIIDTLADERQDFTAFTLGQEEYANKESEYFFIEYDTKRRELGIKTKLIGHESQRKFFKDAMKKDKNIETRFLDYKLPTGVIIYGNSVATMVWSEIPTAFVIDSKQVADAYRKFFKEMWKRAKR